MKIFSHAMESNEASNPAIPAWVSSMGLEWLYELLSKSDDLWRGKLSRQE